VDLVYYRGYLIYLKWDELFWRFMASPAQSDLPILSRAVSLQFAGREDALLDAKRQIDQLLTQQHGAPNRLSLSAGDHSRAGMLRACPVWRIKQDALVTPPARTFLRATKRRGPAFNRPLLSS